MPGLQADPEVTDPVVATTEPRLWRILGPGLITGASDDDPSGIATYSQAGAAYGYALAWTLVVTYPLMVAVQMIAARVGRTTGDGLAGVLRKHAPGPLLQAIVAVLFIANTINLGADLGAMADAATLLLPGPRWPFILLFSAACVFMQVFLQYTRYVAVLKWLTLALFTYIGALALTHVDWAEFLRGLVPRFRFDPDEITTVVAVLGTTISPYLFFWQAAEEVEDIHAYDRRKSLRKAPRQGPAALHRIRIDTLVGMGFSNLVALAILVTTAATLHPAGIRDIQSSAEAAKALEPIAGRFAALFFTLGILGTGLLAVPVLAGSAAYALGEARRWPVGFSRQWQEAKAFYGAVAIATLLGMVMTFSEVNPIRALYWSAVLNGVAAVPVMVAMMWVATSQRVMGRFAASGPLSWLGWIACGLMGLAALAMIASLLGWL